MANEQKPILSRGSLILLLWSFLWGLAWFQLLSGGDLAVVVVAIVLGVIFFLKRDRKRLLPHIAGVALAVDASLLVPGVGWPGEALLVALAGAWLI